MIKTAESVSAGHPDKVCDQISDAILDEFLAQDPNSKVACECFITNNLLVIGGEAHSKADVDIIGIAKRTIENIGYNGTNGFDPTGAIFVNTMHEQSSDIRQGVELDGLIGAGDQGTVYGFACHETKQLLPLEHVLASEMIKAYDKLRRTEALCHVVRPDAKCQFTVDTKNPDDKTIVFSFQHEPGVTPAQLSEIANAVLDEAASANPELKAYFSDTSGKILINPTGSFIIGGPEGDTGLTGRKIIVDTYGGRIPHGGGAFSGKDPTKVDRSAAYYARYIAKNLVAAGIGNNITVRLSYAIGVPEPVDIDVSGSLSFPEEQIIKFIKEEFNPTPINIITALDLKRPIYKQTATYGHFNDPEYPWEKTDKVNVIQKTFFNMF